MIGQETHEVERKIAAILEIFSGDEEPVGGRIIPRGGLRHSVYATYPLLGKRLSQYAKFR